MKASRARPSSDAASGSATPTSAAPSCRASVGDRRGLRVSAGALALALALASGLAVTWSTGCGSSGFSTLEHCETPTIGEKGVDDGPDPCHCNVPPPDEASFLSLHEP
jgi:hypothetical protein